MKTNPAFLWFLSAILSSTLPTSALDVYWDGTDITANADGGTGTWDTSTTNWDNAATAGTNSVFTALDNAFFGGASGTVTTAAAFNAGTVTFTTAGYTIDTGANAMTWATLAGTGGFTKSGSATLTLTNSSSASGTVTINAGRITLGNNSALGTASVTLNGGTLERNVADTVTNSIAIGASGGTILGRQPVDDYTNFSGLISGSGALTIQGLVTLSNTSNSHSGNITISNASASYLRLSASEVLGNTSAVTMGGANANFRLDGTTETIGSIAGSGRIFAVGGASTLKFGGDNSSTSYTGAVDNGGGTLFLVKQGSGTFTLTPSAATFQGLTISNGTVIAGNGTYGTATITLGDADTGANNVAFLTTTAGSSRAITVSASGSGTATIGSTTGAGAGNVVFSGVHTLNRATTLTAASTDRTTWSGRITGNVGTLTFAGPQRIVLESANGLNDFVGDVVISGSGTVLQIGAGTLTGENIPDTASVTVGAGTFLKLASNANSTETINALNGTGNVRRHEGVGGLATLVLGASNGTGSFGGTLTNGLGTLAITKTGSGTQTITSVSGNTASGGITVNGGTLKFTGTAGFDAGTFATAQTYTVNTGGTLEISGDWLTKSTSTYNINAGGTLAFTKTTGDTTVNYVNNLNLTDATVNGPGSYRVGNNTTATHTFSGNLGNTVASGFGMVRNGGPQTVNLTVNDGTADADLTVSGVIYDVFGFAGSTLNKQGAGKMVLTAANTYTGTTNITGGTLALTGSGSLASSSIIVGASTTFDVLGVTGGYTSGAGQTISGTGTIVGNINIGGILAPGNSPGDLNFADNLGLLGTVNLEITGIGAGAFDRLVGDGANTITLGGILNLNNTGYTATLNDTITVFSNWQTYSGSFASITGTNLGGGLSWDTSNLGTNGTLTVIPEPAAALLGGLGLLALLRRRRN